MVWFIFAIIFAVIAGVGFWLATKAAKAQTILKTQAETVEEDRYGNRKQELRNQASGAGTTKFVARIAAAVFTLFTVLALVFSTVFTQGVGEAKVLINIDGTVAGEKLDPGFGVKAPWQSFNDWDLFSQEVLYAGGEVAPSYSGGTVNGQQVTVAVGGINGGSTQANLDISVVYSLDAEQVTPLYKKYKSQERFTKQVIEKTILTTIRQIPSQYNATEFRGTARQEAADKILDSLNEKLNKQGVTVDFVNLQDVRYPDNVEKALAAVEEANQQAQKAEAEKRTAEVTAQTKVVEAQGVADAAVVAAKGQADANALLNQSLTPQILQQKYIDALGEGTIYVVPDGSTPFVGTK